MAICLPNGEFLDPEYLRMYLKSQEREGRFVDALKIVGQVLDDVDVLFMDAGSDLSPTDILRLVMVRSIASAKLDEYTTILSPRSAPPAPSARPAPPAPSAPSARRAETPEMDLQSIMRNATGLMSDMSMTFTQYVIGEPKITRKTVSTSTTQKGMECEVSEMRGDGACWIRAFLSGIVLLLTGVVLPRDPKGMTEFVVRAKELMVAYIRLLILKGDNVDFVADLFRSMEHGGRTSGNFDEYISMLMHSDCRGGNPELRVLCGIFGLVNCDFGQVNVIYEKPLIDGTFYQSLRAYDFGGSPKFSLFYVPGHFDLIISTERPIPARFSPEGYLSPRI